MSKNGVHLIMPMGGSGSRFYKNGINIPKPMIMLKGYPFFYWATRSISKYNNIVDLTFVVLKQHIENFSIDDMIKKYFPEANIIVIKEVLHGPVLTCMNGVSCINDDLPIIFNDCDHLFKSTTLNEKLSNELSFDGGLVSFTSKEPQFGYIKFQDERIIGTVEKNPVSDRAICGAYLFKNKEIFLDAANEYLKKCEYTEYFMSGVYNIMCDNGLSIEEFAVDYHINFGTPEEYEDAKNKNFFDID